MNPAFYAIAAIVVGFVLLTVSADRFVNGAATAKVGHIPDVDRFNSGSNSTSAPEIPYR